jgi:phospholipid/cholesterol/gamma-HCH transport system substrate-binding protein
VSDYETMQRRRSFVVGIFVIFAVFAFFWMIFKFGDLPIVVSEIKSYEIRIQFPSAPGVQRDTPVRFCGYQIGTVTEVNPPQVMRDIKTNQYYYQTLVIVSIDNAYKNIPERVEAKLMTRGFGSSYIELVAPPIDVRGEKVLVEGSLLQGSTGVTSEFFPEQMQKNLDVLITKISTLVDNTNEIIGDINNQTNFGQILENLANASSEANDLIAGLKDAVAAAKTTFQNADEQMNTLTQSIVNTSDKLSRVLTDIDVVVEKVNSGQGTAGKLINDGRLYEQLLEDSRQLDLILKDLRGFVEQSKQKGLPIKLK